MRLVILFLGLIINILISNPILGQDKNSVQKLNTSRKPSTVQFQIGLLYFLSTSNSMFSAKYSRFVIGLNKPSMFHVMLGAGFGGRAFRGGSYVSESYYFLAPSATFLIGRTSRFFEAEIGDMIPLNYPSKIQDGVRVITRKIHFPYIKSGFRYQNHDGGLLFRVGFSIPIGWYMGLGYVF